MDDIIIGVIIGVLLLCLLAFLLIYGLYVDKERKKYLSTLNDHDLAVIQKYFNCSLYPFKKGDKK